MPAFNPSQRVPARFDSSQTMSQAPIRIKTTPNLISIKYPATTSAQPQDYRDMDHVVAQGKRFSSPEVAHRDQHPSSRSVVISAPQFRIVTLNPASLLAAQMQCKGTVDIASVVWPEKKPQDHLAIELFGVLTDLTISVGPKGQRRVIGKISELQVAFNRQVPSVPVTFASQDVAPEDHDQNHFIRLVCQCGSNEGGTSAVTVWWWSKVDLELGEGKMLNQLVYRGPNKHIIRGTMEQ
eukprot:TRINITY_DN2466_c0_g2_i3.p1 TRINITY_DN2466_c0_g2~~TRINITY_DN2466_c0_g2_i3.p1  ORF type:complete len:238 (-),score=33.28 TRINITY_DN2466_c0_g2_i3:732-1445(-)